MVTRYERGRDTEYKIQKLLESVGYNTIRSAGSKGIFDVIAFNALGTRFIQCKRKKKLHSDSYEIDREKIRESILPPNSTGELWVWADDEKRWVIQEVIKTGGK